jgi:hypothetical protein
MFLSGKDMPGIDLYLMGRVFQKTNSGENLPYYSKEKIYYKLNFLRRPRKKKIKVFLVRKQVLPGSRRIGRRKAGKKPSKMGILRRETGKRPKEHKTFWRKKFWL